MIEFLGGPLDGGFSDERSELLPFLVVQCDGEACIYKRRCCGKCSSDRAKVPYCFVGYDDPADCSELSDDPVSAVISS
jgi:hypothetical protein